MKAVVTLPVWLVGFGRHQLADSLYDWWVGGTLTSLRARCGELEARAARCGTCRPENAVAGLSDGMTLAQVSIPATPGAVRTQR